MLVEKYRPRSLDGIIGQKRIVQVMRGYVLKQDMPNLLFVGKSGTGKTAMAYALAFELGCVGRRNFLELNASDERGIDTIRNVVKNFAKTKGTSRCEFKILLLDEADALTRQAQMALRRIMEQYYRSVRFILTVNTLGRLLPAISSRCAIFHFRGLHPANMRLLLRRVATAEGKRFLSDFTIDAIVKVARGDARLALNILEGVLHLEEPTAEDVYNLVGETEDANVFRIIHRALQGRIDSISMAKQMLDDGASSTALINTIYGIAMKGGRLDEKSRLQLLKAIGDVPFATDDQRLMSILAKIILSVSE